MSTPPEKNISDPISILRSQFELQLQVKTGWGRNEVLQAFDRAHLILLQMLIKDGTRK